MDFFIGYFVLEVGDYRREGLIVSRSFCFVINVFVNYGFIEWDGKKIYMKDFNVFMWYVGMSLFFGFVFVILIYFEYYDLLKLYCKKLVSMM